MSEQSSSRRRERVEPNIYKRSNAAGVDVFEIGYRDAAGTQRWRTVEGGITAARSVRNDLLGRKSRHERVSANPRLRFGDAADAWLAGPVSTLRPATRAVYLNHIETHLRPRWGVRDSTGSAAMMSLVLCATFVQAEAPNGASPGSSACSGVCFVMRRLASDGWEQIRRRSSPTVSGQRQARPLDGASTREKNSANACRGARAAAHTIRSRCCDRRASLRVARAYLGRCRPRGHQRSRRAHRSAGRSRRQAASAEDCREPTYDRATREPRRGAQAPPALKWRACASGLRLRYPLGTPTRPAQRPTRAESRAGARD